MCLCSRFVERRLIIAVACLSAVVGSFVQQRQIGPRPRRRATIAQEDVATDDVPMELSVAERARTTAELGCVSGAALSTRSVSLKGCPWTSYVDYVLDSVGAPVFLLRESAEHTSNLDAEPMASVLVQGRGDLNAARPRVTMSGRVSGIADGEDKAALELAFSIAHPYADDLLSRTDFKLCRLEPLSVFYVGGFGVAAQWVDPADYAVADADFVAAGAAALADDLNSPRHADDLRVAAAHLLECPDAESISVAAVDSLGLDFRVNRGPTVEEYRVAYRNRPRSPEDVKSELNKLLQEAWEAEQGISFDGSYATKPRVKKYAQT